jgi:alginate O-acetyltransferase complex protein AlgI
VGHDANWLDVTRVDSARTPGCVENDDGSVRPVAHGPRPTMRFDSVTFWLFFAVAWAVWRLLPLRAAKGTTLAASLLFYGWWRPEYLLLILFSASFDYYVARRIATSANSTVKKRWMLATLVSNLGLLSFFKYTPLVFQTLGWIGAASRTETPDWLAHWVVPVGISFYTFQTLSYTIDVYRGRLAPCRSFVDFFLFVSFFPQLVAGPILRATELLPQLDYRRRLSWIRVQMGLYRCVSGLFLKIVVADGLAEQVSWAFTPSRAADIHPLDAWLGVICFGAQIFADFAGYSSIAIGLAHLMGLSFPENFRYPYISRSLSEFWKRWHISLSRWLRDYLYIPLGGSRLGKVRTYFNVIVTMLLGGLWHGASWTYVAWGLVHGAGLAIERALGWQGPSSIGPSPLGGWLDAGLRCVRIVVVFVIVHTAWVFFRAPDFTVASTLLGRMYLGPFTGSAGASVLLGSPHLLFLLPVLALHTGQVAHEWLGLRKTTALRVALSVLWLTLLCLVDRGEGNPFLYFQF